MRNLVLKKRICGDAVFSCFHCNTVTHNLCSDIVFHCLKDILTFSQYPIMKPLLPSSIAFTISLVAFFFLKVEGNF